MLISDDGTLTDTGPLFALADSKGQPEQNKRCQSLLLTLPMPLVTTLPCLTEAMYMRGRTGGWFMQRYIARLLREGTLRIGISSEAGVSRALDLMDKYQDRPMDLADASLVALAEARGYQRIFSIDSDFYVYRLADGSALEVVPGPMTQQRSKVTQDLL